MNFIQDAEALARNYLNVTPEIVINSLELGLIACTFWAIYLWRSSEKNLPPGPVGVPILGYLPFLGKEAYRTLHDLTFTYGPIFSLYLGRRLVVVLGTFEVVKEALSNNDILDRPKNPPNHLLPDSTSLSISNGQVWKEQRRTSVRILRDLGMEKPAMETQIQEELNKFTKEIDSRRGHAMNLDEVLLPSVSNNILAMLIGHSLDYKHKDRIFLNTILKTMVLYFRPTRLHAYFPNAKFWMAKFKIWGYDQMQDKMNSLSNFLEEVIKKHKEHFDKQAPTSYIDAYLLTMANRDKNSSFTDKMLKGNFQSLLGAGSSPTQATIKWALASMILYPEIQEKVHQELDSVIGKDRLPSWSDHISLPYTLAVVYETLRQYSTVPISMLRSTAKRCKIAGYDIPKDSIIMTNIWGVHHDPQYWEDPSSFKPERFLQNGKVVRPPAFIPFSYGKRNCLGEHMAEVEVFLYFTRLMQRYIITLPDNVEKKFNEVLGIAKVVFLSNICLKLRDEVYSEKMDSALKDAKAK